MDRIKDKKEAGASLEKGSACDNAIYSERKPVCSGEIDVGASDERLNSIADSEDAGVKLDDPTLKEVSQDATIEHYEKKLKFERATTLKKIRVIRSGRDITPDQENADAVPQSPMPAPEADLYDDFGYEDTPVQWEDLKMRDEIAAEDAADEPKTSDVEITAAGTIITPDVQSRVKARITLSGVRLKRAGRTTGLPHEEED